MGSLPAGRLAAIAICTLLPACRSGVSASSGAPTSTSAAPPASVAAPPPPRGSLRFPSAAGDPGYLELIPLPGAPLELVPVEGAKGKLLCSTPPPGPQLDFQRRCLCVEPLECPDGKCITIDENVAIFERALHHPKDGRTVSCQRAETGTCGLGRYFHFLGDIYRDELRVFGRDGKLVGRLDRTDYDAYCEGRASARWVGKLPDAAEMKQDKLLCGEAREPLRTPLASVESILFFER